MATVTVTVVDVTADEASLTIDWGPGGYDENSGAHRLAGTIFGAIERTGPVEDLHEGDEANG